MPNYNELKGNNLNFSIEKNKPNILKGKTLLFLGASFTYGHASFGESFVEYIEVRNDCTCIKEAVSGTTLVEHIEDSYITRLKKVPLGKKYDALLCQLSSNDVRLKQEFGVIKESDYDTKTICGAIQYIAKYARDVLKCPVIFYTCPYFDKERYQKLVSILNEIATKMKFSVIDMYNDKNFNNISAETYALYMADPVHPTKAGYYYWLTPYIESHLFAFFTKLVR